MELTSFFKSVLDQDRAPIVLCNLNHIILYMNDSAIDRYNYVGGAALIGKSLFFCHNKESQALIEKVIKWFEENKDNNIVYESRNEQENKDVYIVALRDDDKNLIGYYEKHEYRDKESANFYDLKS